MRFIIQRVEHAKLSIEDQVYSQIQHGLLVYIGISQSDNMEIAEKMVRKLVQMRIFEDENGKTNLSLDQVEGSLLLVSQFTLYADCKKGNRPSFIDAAKPDQAMPIYESIIASCKKSIPNVQTGVFGADMKIESLNSGPFTIILDSEDL